MKNYLTIQLKNLMKYFKTASFVGMESAHHRKLKGLGIKNLIKMNIIICGRVGFTIAKLLSEQGHSITVIDQSSDDIQKINDSLDVKAIVEKAIYPSILEKLMLKQI